MPKHVLVTDVMVQSYLLSALRCILNDCLRRVMLQSVHAVLQCRWQDHGCLKITEGNLLSHSWERSHKKLEIPKFL